MKPEKVHVITALDEDRSGDNDNGRQTGRVRQGSGLIRRQAKPFSWGLRNWVQLGVFLLTLAIGLQFYLFVWNLERGAELLIPRPSGVEGFLPIGALIGWRYFILTGNWDQEHPAGMVILAFAILLALLLRKSFCGWFCPVGTLSEWLWKLGRKWFGKNYIIPPWLDFPLRSLKYLLLSFFLWAIFYMPASELYAFLNSSYYRVSDVKMLFFFTRMSTATAVTLLLLISLSLLFRNFWCRYLCPYGALLGIIALFSPTQIKRQSETCTSCGLCTRVCPYHLPVDRKEKIISPECNGCLDCTQVCPVKDTLELKTEGLKRSWRPRILALTIILSFLSLVYLATITGHWKSAVTDQEYELRLKEIDSPLYNHPGR